MIFFLFSSLFLSLSVARISTWIPTRVHYIVSGRDIRVPNSIQEISRIAKHRNLTAWQWWIEPREQWHTSKHLSKFNCASVIGCLLTVPIIMCWISSKSRNMMLLHSKLYLHIVWRFDIYLLFLLLICW